MGGRALVRRRGKQWLAAALVVVAVALLVSACGGAAGADGTAPPAVIEHVKGSKVERVRLTAEAARRIGVRTTPVRRNGAGTGRLIIPYGALLYDPDGTTWTYTNPRPLVFQRQHISVARIEGGSVVLSQGPRAGTRVVTVGAEELWGVEYGGIKED